MRTLHGIILAAGMNISELKFATLLLLPALVYTGGCADNAQETIYTNGFVYTVNPSPTEPRPTGKEKEDEAREDSSTVGRTHCPHQSRGSQ